MFEGISHSRARELCIEQSAINMAICQLLVDKGLATHDDISRRIQQAKAVADQEMKLMADEARAQFEAEHPKEAAAMKAIEQLFSDAMNR